MASRRTSTAVGSTRPPVAVSLRLVCRRQPHRGEAAHHASGSVFSAAPMARATVRSPAAARIPAAPASPAGTAPRGGRATRLLGLRRHPPAAARAWARRPHLRGSASCPAECLTAASRSGCSSGGARAGHSERPRGCQRRAFGEPTAPFILRRHQTTTPRRGNSFFSPDHLGAISEDLSLLSPKPDHLGAICPQTRPPRGNVAPVCLAPADRRARDHGARWVVGEVGSLGGGADACTIRKCDDDGAK